jgi:hypothetical protein
MSDVSSFDPVTGRIETDRTIQRGRETRCSHHSVRLPTVPELADWLSNAGFQECAFSDRAGRPLRVDSWRLVATAVRS